MACCLTPSTGAKEDFLGTGGCEVSVKLKGPAGVAVKMVHISYAGTAITTDPPTFKVKTGARMMVVLAEASKPGVILQLIESCDGNEQVLDRFHFDPMNPARGYIVRA